ncbi:MAG: D-Ala-D-Ala carboxypeptidase family metallohydrolase [Oligoflexales bacterium]
MEEICKGFPLSEFIKSDTATRLKIKNNPSKYFKRNMKTFCPVIEYLDKVSGGKLEISSGYRSSQVNFYADGANNSYHTIGLALDIKPGIPFYVAEKIISKMDPAISMIRYKNHLHIHKTSRNPVYETKTFRSENGIRPEQNYSYQDFSLILSLVRNIESFRS